MYQVTIRKKSTRVYKENNSTPPYGIMNKVQEHQRKSFYESKEKKEKNYDYQKKFIAVIVLSTRSIFPNLL